MHGLKRRGLLLLLACWGIGTGGKTQKLIDFVDPFIGTGGHGHTYPGATVPFGMVQLSPDNGSEGEDWSSGYHYSDSIISGFSHMHLSGTGAGDWCDISVLPSNGLLPDTGRFCKIAFRHQNETASPGYYSVLLENGIRASLTATERCGFHAYQFPAGGLPVIRFDLGFAINKDRNQQDYIRRIDDSTIVGYRYSTGWARFQRVYFAARCSVPFSGMRLWADGQVYPAERDSLSAKWIRAQLVFGDQTPQTGRQTGQKGQGLRRTIQMKVALSMTGTEKALEALGEAPGWDFGDLRRQAEDKWEKELGKVRIRTSDKHLERIFYTAYYHTCMAPVLYSDADGEYRNAKGSLHKMSDGQRYTVYSLWDTFRALHPLFTVLHTERLADILNSMLAFHDENGLLPVWDLSTNETGTMTGYHSVPVLADAILKNEPGLDAERAYRAMTESAHQSIRGTPDYMHYGYLPQDKGGSSVTVTLEYGYDDWCIAQVAKKLGKRVDYEEYMKRSEGYKLLFDPVTGFMRARNSDGSRIEPFDPFWVGYGRDIHYREGNAWQYSFFVPQDVKAMIALYGGNSKFIARLDALFGASPRITGPDAGSDVIGMIGQYAHGNEPSHHIAYLYSYAGAPWKTQEKVRLIVDSMYHDGVDGYAGNEDCGQISAWGVWSILGLYPANPVGGRYVFGSPDIDEAVLALPGKKQLVIRALHNGRGRPYIKAVRFNNRPYPKSYIDHADLMQGGILEFVMSAVPNKRWGAAKEDRPGE